MNGQARAELLAQLVELSENDLVADGIADDDLLQDLGIDSLDAIMLVLDFEESYDVEVTPDELSSLDTVGSLVALIDLKRSTGLLPHEHAPPGCRHGCRPAVVPRPRHA